ncbi:hypothetical protein PF005_g15245 [Phytophthora fragariae]|uniref:Uncharacterized protein n=1 Tax=Phytophthora fragariae TaxID=53985 RepID=A0A6A3U3Y2_9STRA|nr:hypothetical protein PF003_g1106 [Phytophthora fragariae]KAE8933496.1 hypothetical protein PF009_g16501 [Phytophthora fragariae]KAE9014948.1 hypothetical protein PF011_g7836 [Phytophthora fragariae]KAE9100328.1 hypothetical protein PF007_g15558 [Phytophthora fragariae]KAE9115558.1 hypothetical protein PF010_g9272 [Phytophthora fragariae]
MGCCLSKCPGTTPGKEYAATTTEVAPMFPSSGSVNHVETVMDTAVHNLLMDRGDGKSMDKSDDDEPVAYKTKTASVAQDAAVERRPEEVVRAQSPPSPPPKKASRSADDIPISSTYHRVHSAEVAKQEAKRQEELRIEAEQRERDVREYKAAMQLA